MICLDGIIDELNHKINDPTSPYIITFQLIKCHRLKKF